MCLMASVSTCGKVRNSPREFAFLRQGKQLALGDLNLLASRCRQRMLVGAVDGVLAHLDQTALEGEVVDDPSVFRRVDDGLGGVCEPAEIPGAVQLPQRRVLLEQQLQRHGIG